MDVSKWKSLVLLLLFLIFILSFGCFSGEDSAKNNPKIKSFLQEHPESIMSFYGYSRVLFDEEKDFWTRGCGGEIEYGEYNIFRAEDDSAVLKALFKKSDNSLICLVVTQKDDWNLFIKDPNLEKTCLEQNGIICKPNQTCSVGFTKANNTKRCCKGVCVDVNSMDLDFNSSDFNGLNGQIKNGSIEEDVVEPDYVPCSGISEVVFCDETQYCSKVFVDSMDDTIECGCAECTNKNCNQLGGQVCPLGNDCVGNIVSAPDAINCCIGDCYSVDVNIMVEMCIENWVCTDFSACINEVKTRTCVDINSCGTQENKPQESIPC